MLQAEQTTKKRKVTKKIELSFDLIVNIASYLYEFKDYMKLCQLSHYHYQTLLDTNSFCFKNAIKNGMYISLLITTANERYEIGGCVLKSMELGQFTKNTGVVTEYVKDLRHEYDFQLKFITEIIIEEFYIDHVEYVCKLISKGLLPSLKRVVITDVEYTDQSVKDIMQRMIKSGDFPTTVLTQIQSSQKPLTQLANPNEEGEEVEIEIELTDSEEEIEIPRGGNNQEDDEEEPVD